MPLTSTVVPLRVVVAEALALCARAGVAGIAVSIRARTMARAEIRKILLCFIWHSPLYTLHLCKICFRVMMVSDGILLLFYQSFSGTTLGGIGSSEVFQDTSTD